MAQTPARITNVVVACTGLLLLAASAANAQMLQDQTTTRFPQPNLLEYTSQLTIGDIDGDTDLDIIFANGAGFNCPVTAQVLRVFINNGSGVFTDESVARTGGLAFKARGVELGDCDGDGDLDIIVANDCASLPALLINNGSGVFTDETAARLPNILLSSSRAQFADVDNDGDLDLYLVNGGASRFGSGQGKLYINDGTGHYTDGTATHMPAGNVSQPMDCIFGDIDGDLDLDLRICSRANQSKIYKNNGLGVFSTSTSPADNNCYSYDFGDIDGDGDLDMLGANGAANGSLGEILLVDNGSGLYSVNAWAGSTVDDNDSKFFDFDNDGDMDMVIASLSTSERAYINNGNSTFTLAANIFTAISDSSLDIKVADLNGDGRYDVVTAQGESGSFVNRIYINVTGNPDTIVPNIVKTEQLPNATNAGPFAVRTVIYDAHTSDRGFHDKGITLHYSVGPGPEQTVPMKWVGNAEWRGVMPALKASGTVSYYVTATDFANNTATGPTKQFTLQLPCPADQTGDHVVNTSDLLTVINNWGVTAVTHPIDVQDFFFSPNVIDAKSGDTLHFQWVNGIHTATSGTSCGPDGKFNQAITSGQTTLDYQIPANFIGALPFFCIPHCADGMTGTANVVQFVGDVNGDGTVNSGDLLGVINNWGNCP